MRKRALTSLALAVASGCLAGYLALGYLEVEPAAATEGEPGRRSIVVAAQDLPLGTLLEPAHLKTVPWLGEGLPPGFIASPEDAIGHGLLAPLRADEPVVTARLAGRGSGAGLPVTIPAGMRAVSVRVDEVTSVGGFVAPGTRVDVLVTVPAGNGDGAVTRMILQNVTTLATDQTIQADPEGKPQTASVITLLVSPREAELLALATAEGTIQLALRNGLDLEVAQTEGAWLRSLVREQETRRSAPPVRRQVARTPARPTIEVFQGGVRTVATF